MKLSDDQKKLVRSIAIMPICYIAYTIVYHLIKGNADWTEILWVSVGVIITAIVIGIFFILGSSIPKK